MRKKYREEMELVAGGWTRWVPVVQDGYKMSCCDCGLVHALQFRVVEGRVELRAKRDNRATGQRRRWMSKNNVGEGKES